jgi:hypothetical protein
VRRQYEGRATFEEFENPMDPVRLPAENRRSNATRRRRIVSAYRSTKSNRNHLSVTNRRRRI